MAQASRSFRRGTPHFISRLSFSVSNLFFMAGIRRFLGLFAICFVGTFLYPYFYALYFYMFVENNIKQCVGFLTLVELYTQLQGSAQKWLCGRLIYPFPLSVPC